MYKVLTIVGARPQFIKASAINRKFRETYFSIIEEVIVHTGQHYDHNMSEVFFEELSIDRPQYNLNVGSGDHGKQTGSMISSIEDVIHKEKPHVVLVYGDTNSTLAGALAASKMHIPVVHIEAGLRSFNKSMPEEINRIVCDHVSTLLFAPTDTGYKNLINEGFKPNTCPPYSIDNPNIIKCGDIMYDNSLFFSKKVSSKILDDLNLRDSPYVLATLHRDSNTDERERLENIIKSICFLSNKFNIPFILPLHPRTKRRMTELLSDEIISDVKKNKLINILPPASFLDMTFLESKASLIMTDSGGVQKESFFFKKPCIVFRSETEWSELLTNGLCILCDADFDLIVKSFEQLLNMKTESYPAYFGDGNSSEEICKEILKFLKETY